MNTANQPDAPVLSSKEILAVNDDIHREIIKRNALRAAAKLPLLDVAKEFEIESTRRQRKPFYDFMGKVSERIEQKFIRIARAGDPRWQRPKSLLNGGLAFSLGVALRAKAVYLRLRRMGKIDLGDYPY